MKQQKTITISLSLSSLALVLGLFSACSKDPQVPAYIHIDAIPVSTDYLLEGSNSSKVSDAWITVDGKSIGTFELPATIPVLASEGSHQISVDAGILMNGIAASRVKYPYYTTYSVSKDLKKGAILTVTPDVKYTEYAFFPWKEDFDNNSSSLELTAKSDQHITIQRATGDLKFEGQGSAYITMTPDQTTFECATVDEVALPKDGTEIYLELNFKTTVPISVGLYSNTASGVYRETAETLNTTTTWKKVYINLTSVATRHADAGGFKLYFSSTNNGSNAEIFLDNIKLVY